MLDHIRCPTELVDVDLNVQRLTSSHALLRRGLNANPPERSPSAFLPQGHILLDDSLNTAVANLVPVICSTHMDLPMHGRASQYFLANQLVPSSLAHLSRFFSLPSSHTSLDLARALGVLECSHLYRTIIQMRMNINQSLNIPSDVLLAQVSCAYRGK